MPDGRIGAVTLAALDRFLAIRGKRSGEVVLMRALEALQGERYLRLAERLRLAAQAPADPRRGGATPVPGLPAAAGRAAEAAVESRFPATDALTATEQAIQLDELIKWVRAQAEVDVNTGD